MSRVSDEHLQSMSKHPWEDKRSFTVKAQVIVLMACELLKAREVVEGVRAMQQFNPTTISKRLENALAAYDATEDGE